MLKLISPAPFWLDILPGARIQVDPVDATALLLARHAASHARGDGGPDAGVHMQVAFTRALALRGIRAWEGIGETTGGPVEVTPDRIGRLLNDPSAFESIDRLYAQPVLEREAEKNALSPSPTGRSARAVKPTVKTAARTASKPVKPAAPVKAALRKKTVRGATKAS